MKGQRAVTTSSRWRSRQPWTRSRKHGKGANAGAAGPRRASAKHCELAGEHLTTASAAAAGSAGKRGPLTLGDTDVCQERRSRVLAHMTEEAMDAGIEVKGASSGTAAPSAITHPIGEGVSAAEVAGLTENADEEDAVPHVGRAVVVEDVDGAPSETITAGTMVKTESHEEVEPYDGSYACGFCSESVRGTKALKCSQCSSNPVHWACVAGTKYAGQCATCDGETMDVWRGASAWTAAPSEIFDLTGEERGAAEVAALAEGGARQYTAPAVGSAVVAADAGRKGYRGSRADAGSGRSGNKGKEPAWAEAGSEAWGEGAATSAGAGAVGGGSKRKGRVDKSPARVGRGSLGGKRSRGESGGGPSMHSGGAGSSRAAEEQSGEGSSKRAAPDGGEEGRSGGGKRARLGQSKKCEHNRQRSQCKECGGASICQHARRRSECKECGGASI